MQDTTKMKDRYGLPMSTSSTLAAEHYVEGLDLMLARNFGAEERFRQAIEADEGFALAYAGLAMTLHLRAQIPEAKENIKHAQSLKGGISRREQRQIEALTLFIDGQGSQSLALVREQFSEFPRDAMMMRLANRLYINGCNSSGAGVPNFPQEYLALMKTVESDYGDEWAFLGHYSFAHHESGLMEDALRLAERSLELRYNNAVASHSIAHSLFEMADHSRGADFLSTWLKSYDNRSEFHVHVSWHHALFQLAMGRYEQAISLYENNIRPSVVANSPLSLSDSASLLWRLQIYSGAPAPAPWEEVRAQAAPAAGTPGPAFRDGYAALAFAASGDEANMSRMIDRLRGQADKGDALAGEITLPLVQGIDAFANGDYDEAIRLLKPAHELTRMGNSHAQREVFEDTLLESYLRVGQFDKAEAMLRGRLKQRESTRDTFWLGRAQAGSGQADAAKSSLREVTQQWQDVDQGLPEIIALNSLVEKVG